LKWIDNSEINGMSFPNPVRANLYSQEDMKLFPLVKDPVIFDRELPEFVERHSRDAVAHDYAEPFLMNVAQPMFITYHYYKRGELETAVKLIDHIHADDWRITCKQWLVRRVAKRLNKVMKGDSVGSP
jgi:hypothetical protein